MSLFKKLRTKHENIEVIRGEQGDFTGFHRYDPVEKIREAHVDKKLMKKIDVALAKEQYATRVKTELIDRKKAKAMRQSERKKSKTGRRKKVVHRLYGVAPVKKQKTRKKSKKHRKSGRRYVKRRSHRSMLRSPTDINKISSNLFSGFKMP